MIINVWQHAIKRRGKVTKHYRTASAFGVDDDAIEEIIEGGDSGGEYQFTWSDHESAGEPRQYDYRERVQEYETNQWFDRRQNRLLARVG